MWTRRYLNLSAKGCSLVCTPFSGPVAKSTSRLQDIGRLEFYGRQIPKARVQPLLVVDLLYELSDVLLGILKPPVVLYVDLLHLQGPEETLRLGVLVGVAHSSHADEDASVLQSSYILSACVLDALLRMMYEPRLRQA